MYLGSRKESPPDLAVRQNYQFQYHSKSSGLGMLRCSDILDFISSASSLELLRRDLPVVIRVEEVECGSHLGVAGRRRESRAERAELLEADAAVAVPVHLAQHHPQLLLAHRLGSHPAQQASSSSLLIFPSSSLSISLNACTSSAYTSEEISDHSSAEISLDNAGSTLQNSPESMQQIHGISKFTV
nr:hypothetical protein Iba_chr10fCG2380 [Ipomoea batatas]